LVDRQIVFLDFGDLPSGHGFTMLFFTRSPCADNVTQTPIANHATEREESGHPRASLVMGRTGMAHMPMARIGIAHLAPLLTRPEGAPFA
jgi:hypothetical protein